MATKDEACGNIRYLMRDLCGQTVIFSYSPSSLETTEYLEKQAWSAFVV